MASCNTGCKYSQVRRNILVRHDPVTLFVDQPSQLTHRSRLAIRVEQDRSKIVIRSLQPESHRYLSTERVRHGERGRYPAISIDNIRG